MTNGTMPAEVRSNDGLGGWVQALGELVCAAKDRDAAWADQERAIDAAHAKLFAILRAAAPQPAERAPLTDAQVVELAKSVGIEADLWEMGCASLVYSPHCNGIPRGDFLSFVRAIEAAHGIKPHNASSSGAAEPSPAAKGCAEPAGKETQ